LVAYATLYERDQGRRNETLYAVIRGAVSVAMSTDPKKASEADEKVRKALSNGKK
jgi:hypothetical protein